jgi:hypothetical protein
MTTPALGLGLGLWSQSSLPVWKPSDEAGYFAHYEADQGLYQAAGGDAATTHGSVVGQWQDLSGNGKHLAQGDNDKRPTLDLTTYAGYPNVKFDGSNDYIEVTGISRSLPTTVFVVAESTYASANEIILIVNDGGTCLMFRPQSGESADNLSAAAPGGSWPDNTRKIATLRSKADALGIRIDSGEEVTAASTPTAGNRVNLGGRPTQLYCACRIYAVLIYNADLDASAQARVRKYLKTKWGTP